MRPFLFAAWLTLSACGPVLYECAPSCIELVCPNGSTACVCGDADAECVQLPDGGFAIEPAVP